MCYRQWMAFVIVENMDNRQGAGAYDGRWVHQKLGLGYKNGDHAHLPRGPAGLSEV
jgi:hypothetical protein